ncbi:MAG: DsrE family protein [Marinicella sp.]
MIKKILLSLIMLQTAFLTMAQMDQFKTGKLIDDFGKIAAVPGMETLPADTKFSVSFDVSKQADVGSLNRSIDSGARFLNMHVDAGLKPEQLKLAFVIHGSAVRDLTNHAFYQNQNDKQELNANMKLINVLQSHGVKFYVCGQSAAYYGVRKEHLIPGVNMSLSAMTAHAQLQQAGYTLNPF